MSKKDRFKMPVAVYLVLKKDNQILMLRRFNTGYEDGNFSLPAGHVDGDESVKQAIIREAEEEAMIKIKHEDLKVVKTIHRRSDDERIDIFLECDKWQGEIGIGEPNKCDRLAWHDTKKLPENTIPFLKIVLEQLNDGNPFMSMGFDDDNI